MWGEGKFGGFFSNFVALALLRLADVPETAQGGVQPPTALRPPRLRGFRAL
jgi:hypothetical protein